MKRRILLALPVAYALAGSLEAQSPAPTPAQVEFFENRIRPALAQQCFACHTNSANGRPASRFASRSIEGRKIRHRGDCRRSGEKACWITAIRQTAQS